jgi:creatinine amidohydrolase
MGRRSGSLMVLLLAGCLAGPSVIVKHDRDTPRPIPALDTVFLEEMTWMEVRDSLRASKTTVLVPTGGIEQNGPYLATGKHNFIIRATSEAIARSMGDALVAPIVPFVPEGNIEPPSGHMRYPGTISLSEDTYERLLIDICTCLRVHGFRDIILLGDSLGNQKGMQTVANRLAHKWAGEKVRVHYLAEYFDYDEVAHWLEGQGVRQQHEDVHDDFIVTAQLMAVDPTTVRMRQRLASGQFRVSGMELDAEQTIAWGKKIIAHRAERSVQAIRKILRTDAQIP